MLVNKWHTFVGSALILASHEIYTTCCLLSSLKYDLPQMQAGLSYCFSIYAPALKQHFDLSQTQLQQLGFAVNLGGYLAIFAGSVYNTYADSHQLGPR
jgi:hypothetical protein